MFKYKRGIPVDYKMQGYIYFTSLKYTSLPEGRRKIIDDMCICAGGEYSAALFSFVTTDMGYVECCREFFISQALLYRCVRKYYILFAQKIDCGLW